MFKQPSSGVDALGNSAFMLGLFAMVENFMAFAGTLSLV
jgi:hypothetical protein